MNLKIEYNINNPVIIPNRTSSIYVTKSGVLKLFLKILKQSKIMPIKKPFNIKAIKTYSWFCKLSPYLNILLNNEPSLPTVVFSE